MHRSSETIGNISGALAKAQAELTNPEKSLVGIIRSPFPRQADRTFRYAPLSSGLDIIRKSLGRQEIATIQSTEIDKEAGLLRLTTILAHSSGEWVSSDWPVCPIADMASAQRMGAALTYARRYALFTLVGITGEDDLDAPDLGAGPNSTAEQQPASDHRNRSSWQALQGQGRARADGKRPETLARSVLGEQLSASLRESLVQQLAPITSEDEAAAWAHRSLPAKNTLTAADAKIVEERFQARVSEIRDGRDPGGLAASSTTIGTIDDPPDSVPTQSVASPSLLDAVSGSQKAASLSAKRSRKSAVGPLGKTVRLRDKDHRRFVLGQPCLVCGRVPSDPHHLTFTQPRALGRRASDEFTVPVCRIHHRELHRSGDEVAWWGRLNVDPLPVALKLWQQSRANGQLFPSPEGVRQTRATSTPEAIAHAGSGARRDPNTPSESDV
jgi:ERF superfamily